MRATAAILLSRQPLRPTAKSGWVQQTIKAVQWIKESNCTLCTSVGMQTWELIAALATVQRLPQRVFIPADDGNGYTQRCRWATSELTLPPPSR